MFKQLIAVLVVALCVGAGTMTAQSQSQTAADTFIWHGELVSVDQATGTFTVKARMLSDAAKDVARFKAGDTVVLTWSGVDKYADAIRHIAKQDVNQKITDPFAVAVELASPDVQNDYVTFKFRAGNAVEGGTHENVYPPNSVGTIELPLCEERALDATVLERPCDRRCACRDSQRLRNLGGHVTVVAHRLAEPTR